MDLPGSLVLLMKGTKRPINIREGFLMKKMLSILLVSALALALTKPLVTRMRARRAVPTNADLNIGRTGCVIAAIAPGRPGRVRLDGVDWSAVCDAPLSEGQACTVLALEGATLTVAPLTAPQAAVR